ncbi:MAG: hypothetical protein IPN10_13310 [Saprospiraceae bacterium]|nr:hypothetical protein [Saprospiraceae bacterium]
MKLKFFPFLLALGIAGSLVLGFSSCGDDEDELPPIDGYNSSDDVAKSNLISKWSFDGTLNETKSGKAPSSAVGNSFGTGIKGQAVTLNNGYLKYPVSISGTIMPSWTISTWVNFANTGNSFTQILGLSETASPDIWGNLNISCETGWFPSSSDTLVPKVLMRPFINNGYSGQDNRPDPKGNPPVGVFKAANTWAHIVARWDQTSSKLQIFGNGTIISNPAWEVRKVDNVEIGATTFKNTDVVLFGSLCSSETGTFTDPLPSWSSLFKGSIDETRIYGKALTDAEIGALYKLEKAGR